MKDINKIYMLGLFLYFQMMVVLDKLFRFIYIFSDDGCVSW